MQYHPPSGSTDPNAPFVGKNVAAGLLGSKVPPGAVEMTQREIVNAIALSGQTPTDTDLNQLTRTIRGGQLDYAPDTGTANALVAPLGLAHGAMKAGLPFKVMKGNAANSSTTPTLTLTGPGGANAITGVITKCDGSPVAAGDLPASAMLILVSDGASWRLLALITKSDVLALIAANAPRIATANVVVCVDYLAGSDNNPGTSAAPFQTILAAINYANSRNVFGGFALTIQLARANPPGSYYNVPGGIRSAVPVTIVGDPANQSNYVLSGTPPGNGSVQVLAQGTTNITLIGCVVYCQGTNFAPVGANYGGFLLLQNVTILTSVQTAYPSITANFGVVQIGTGCIVNGGIWGSIINIGIGGNVTLFATLALQNTPTSTNATVLVNTGSFQVAAGVGNFSGSASGPRYSLVQGLINTAGGGANFIPGSSAGTNTNGTYQ